MDLKEQYEKLLRYCYMKTNDRFLAEDIVQETYLKFWQSHQYEDTGAGIFVYDSQEHVCR